ncbi:hypothetical protein F0562_013355 [Nyssa sinensis]|uniref:Uncharacterized protein n=1 Tax=Nyssa sinensis TaxID=561372 RepID=A0A5J4ZMD1_9ASTE|nr:hypothetical protein F0562_013355 [Nyssa sinensis]
MKPLLSRGNCCSQLLSRERQKHQVDWEPVVTKGGRWHGWKTGSAIWRRVLQFGEEKQEKDGQSTEAASAAPRTTPAGPTGTQGGSSSVLLNPAETPTGSEAIKVALKMGLPPGFNKKGSRQILGELMSGYGIRATGLLMDRFAEVEKASSLQDELKKAQADLKAAQSEIKKGQTDLKAAQSEIKKKQSELLVAQSDLKHAQAKLKVADAELGVAQASVSSLETKCEAFQAENISLGQKLGVMIDQRDLFRRRMDEQKKKFQETEVAMAKKLEEVKEATKEATKTRDDGVDKFNGERARGL